MWTIVLLSAMALILITGQTNKRNYEKVQNSIAEIYKDRLVVKGLIFDLVTDLHQKELALAKQDSAFFMNQNQKVNQRILENIKTFEATKLTQLEEETLRNFSVRVTALINSELKTNFAEANTFTSEAISPLKEQINDLHLNLKTLSKIQLEEGKRKLDKSGDAVESMHFFEKIENYFLIIFGILIFAIIFIFPGSNGKYLLGKAS